MSNIFLAESDEQIAGCFEVMRYLRPHLEREDFVERIRRLQQQGYQLAALEDGGQVVTVAGFWLRENLAWGRFTYLDDLVTAEGERSKGYGDKMFDWLLDHARRHDRQQFHLDSGVQRFGAHRFYLTRRMIINDHHFKLVLDEG